MAKGARAISSATPGRCISLPEEIVAWEILVRLPPKSLLRCRSVCRAWRRITSTRDFLLAHHVCQPSLPIVVSGFKDADGHYQNILTFDHRAAVVDQLQPVARLEETYCLEASCDGLLIVSTYGMSGNCFAVCNPVTRQRAPLPQLSSIGLIYILGMYLHRPTGEYRVLLHRRGHKMWVLSDLLHKGQVGCYIYALGSDKPPRFIGGPETKELCFSAPAVVRDNLHWYSVHNHSEKTKRKPVIVFDTVSELFGQMSAPVVPRTHIFETDGTLGMCNRATEFFDMSQSYECELWEHKYRVKLPVAEITRLYGSMEDHHWYVRVVSAHDNVRLLLSNGRWLFYLDPNGKLVDNFNRDGQERHASELWLKQTLVPHNFFTALEGYAVNTSPFI